MKKTKILFVTPFFHHGGSEIYIYELLNELVKYNYDVTIFSDFPGSLIKQKNLYPVFTNKVPYSGKYFWPFLVLKKLFNYDLEFYFFKRLVRRIKPECIYLNTLMLSKYARYANKLNMPFITHLHELPSTYMVVHNNDFEFIINNSKAVVCCSNAVKKYVDILRKNDVFVQYEHIRFKANIQKRRGKLRKQFNIPEDAFVWLMSGMKTYRKGYDLVIDISKKLQENSSGYLLWVGKSSNTGMEALVKSCNIPNYIETGLLANEDYQAVFSVADGFLLSAREDPFPLVMIEAASYGLPIVSFDSGGVKEFLKPGMGEICKSFDVESITNSMKKVMENPDQYDSKISIIRAKEFDVEIKTKEWIEMIESIS